MVVNIQNEYIHLKLKLFFLIFTSLFLLLFLEMFIFKMILWRATAQLIFMSHLTKLNETLSIYRYTI